MRSGLRKRGVAELVKVSSSRRLIPIRNSGESRYVGDGQANQCYPLRIRNACERWMCGLGWGSWRLTTSFRLRRQRWRAELWTLSLSPAATLCPLCSHCDAARVRYASRERAHVLIYRSARASCSFTQSDPGHSPTSSSDSLRHTRNPGHHCTRSRSNPQLLFGRNRSRETGPQVAPRRRFRSHECRITHHP